MIVKIAWGNLRTLMMEQGSTVLHGDSLMVKCLKIIWFFEFFLVNLGLNSLQCCQTFITNFYWMVIFLRYNFVAQEALLFGGLCTGHWVSLARVTRLGLFGWRLSNTQITATNWFCNCLNHSCDTVQDTVLYSASKRNVAFHIWQNGSGLSISIKVP